MWDCDKPMTTIALLVLTADAATKLPTAVERKSLKIVMPWLEVARKPVLVDA